nr:histidine phosphotransferase family protein [Azospirillum sp. SYSU D00513]
MDIRVLELLASHICHDLVSPVGAIRNGLELIEEMEDEPAGGFMEEAVKLIDHSSGQADRKLRAFRLAYGTAGREQKGFNDIRAAAAGWVSGGRSRLDWPAGLPNDQLAFKRGVAKALLNLVMMAEEALPSGGTITVGGTASEEAGRLTVTAAGRPGALKPEVAAALAGTVPAAELSARSVHPYLTGRLAEDDGLRLSVAQPAAETVVFTVEW